MATRVGRRVLGALLVALPCVACAATKPGFAPDAEYVDLLGDDGDLEARLTVAWSGLADDTLHFRFSVENPGPTLFALVPARFELLDAALASIGIASTDDLPVTVEAGRSATFDMAFPISAPATLDLTTVTLRAQLQGGRWNWSPTFERVGRWQ